MLTVNDTGTERTTEKNIFGFVINFIMRSGQSMLVPWITSVVISDKIIKNQKINKNEEKHGNGDLILSKKFNRSDSNVCVT